MNAVFPPHSSVCIWLLRSIDVATMGLGLGEIARVRGTNVRARGCSWINNSTVNDNHSWLGARAPACTIVIDA